MSDDLPGQLMDDEGRIYQLAECGRHYTRDGYGCPVCQVFSLREAARELHEVPSDVALVDTLPPDTEPVAVAEPALDEECSSCRGRGHFDRYGKPTSSLLERKCLDCAGVGRVPIVVDEDTEDGG